MGSRLCTPSRPALRGQADARRSVRARGLLAGQRRAEVLHSVILKRAWRTEADTAAGSFSSSRGRSAHAVATPRDEAKWFQSPTDAYSDLRAR